MLVLYPLILTSAVLPAVLSADAQPFTRHVRGIPVISEGAVLLNPFMGGINNPQHQFVDIDGDGDLDLFVFDSDASMTLFRNEGTPLAPDFNMCRNCVSVPQFAFWFLFVDLNSDGKPDLTTDDSSSGVRYYMNTGTAQDPAFALQSATMVDTSGLPIIGAPVGAPTFADLNGDSLLDYLSSNISGSFNYYENIGTRTSPLFRFTTSSFQNITILGDTCPSPGFAPLDARRHGGGSLQFADIDANGTNDMFYGDLFSRGVFYMKNIGTPSNPQIQCVTNRFPDPSMVTTGFNQPTLIDIDGSGTLDLFVGVLNLMPRHNFLYFNNVGTASVASLQLQTADFLPSIDVGASAHPVFTDIDGNGTLDLFIGSLDGRVWHFTNNGTPTQPSFVLNDTAFAGITGNFTYAPSFVDIDHDGDQDLCIGRFDGRLKFYRNVGTASAPSLVLQSSPLDTINVNRNASPVFVDIDADGDADLFIGKSGGTVSYYRNDGTDSIFAPVLISANFASITVGEDAIPTFIYNQQRRLYDLVIGNAQGNLFYYENVGDSANPQFLYQTDRYGNVDPMKASSAALVDIDGDGDVDLFVGTSKGGIQFYQNDMITAVEEGRSPVPMSIEVYQNYPNPFNPVTSIEYRVASREYVSLKVYDVLGREVATLVNEIKQPGTYTVTWDASQTDGGRAVSMASGVYYCRLLTGRHSLVKKMILLR